jgi:tetratricopeptide (TPR) repeat protein
VSDQRQSSFFVSYTSVDLHWAEWIAWVLEEHGYHARLQAWDFRPGRPFPSEMQKVMVECDRTIAVLSPAYLGARFTAIEWSVAFEADPTGAEAKLLPIRIADFKPAGIFAALIYVDLVGLSEDAAQGVLLKGIDPGRAKPPKRPAFPLAKSPPPAAIANVPRYPGYLNPAAATSPPAESPSLPHFTGRESELSLLRTRLSAPGSLVPIVGMPGLGKTWLAREFTRRHGAMFTQVIEVDCKERTLADLTGLVGVRLRRTFEGTPEQVAEQQRDILGCERCLLVLDNVESDVPGALLPAGQSSVLVTSQSSAIGFFEEHPAVRPTLFTSDEAHALFSSIHQRPYDRDQADALFAKMGQLPLGIAVAAGVLFRDPGYTVEKIAEEIPPLHDLKFANKNLGDWFDKVISRLAPDVRRLLQAMACCAPSGWDVDFVRQVTQQTESHLLEGLRALLDRSLVEVLEWPRRYRLHALVRLAAAPGPELKERHFRTVYDTFYRLRNDPLNATSYLQEAREALFTTDARNDDVATLTNQVGLAAASVGRMAEAYEFQRRLGEISSGLSVEWKATALGHQAIILRGWGQIDEAIALFKEEEQLRISSQDRSGLARCYGNQAGILRARGQTEEAMALYEKQQRLSLAARDFASVAAGYGNQSLVLQARGEFGKALGLLKKQEAMCEAVSDRGGLAVCRGNQADILATLGRPKEALDLLTEVKRVSEELGDRLTLAIAYGIEGNIASDEGQFTEAMTLYKKKENICRDIRNQYHIALALECQGALLQKSGSSDEGCRLVNEALVIYKTLKLPPDIQRAEHKLRRCDSAPIPGHGSG